MDKCPKCGSTNREKGKLFPEGVLWEIRYWADEASILSFKQKIIAFACLSCGYIELLLKDSVGKQEDT
jgi:predicted nucleic-acid-binding Zn-ribbon protein